MANKKFSFKSDFDEIDLDINIDGKDYDGIKIITNNSELVDEELTYLAILNNMLRKEDRKDEILDALKSSLSPEAFLESVKQLVEVFEGK